MSKQVHTKDQTTEKSGWQTLYYKPEVLNSQSGSWLSNDVCCPRELIKKIFHSKLQYVFSEKLELNFDSYSTYTVNLEAYSVTSPLKIKV